MIVENVVAKGQRQRQKVKTLNQRTNAKGIKI